MFDRLIRRLFGYLVNGEHSPLAMTNKVVPDYTVVPDVERDRSPLEKAESILKRMTMDEKITMLGGFDMLSIHGNERLGLPPVTCSDASAGVRCFGRSTAFPVPVAMAATWNRDLLQRIGESIAEECRAKGISILLGPGVNICRVPTCGRNFEYLGEDPFLAAELVVPYIEGVQGRGVITTVKHFAGNNSEYDRHRMNSEIDERTLHEIYLPAFKAAVQKGRSRSVMCAYNPLNGTYCSENRMLLTEILRDTWGFDGFVISDWISLYSTAGPLKAGLDLEMPSGKYLNPDKIKPLLEQGVLNPEDIDRPVRNLLRVFFEMGIYDRPTKDHAFVEWGGAHSQLSLEGAREAVVLLKNEDRTLPLITSNVRKIAVLGRLAVDTTTCGGGSCCVKSWDKVNILDALRRAGEPDSNVVFVKSRKGSILDPETVRQADAVVVCAGYSATDECESYERSWKLPYGQDELIRNAARLNPHTIVVLISGGDVETESWLGHVPALLHGFFLGQHAGTAIAEVIFGRTNPSGKLPFTMARRWEDILATRFYVERPATFSLARIFGPQGIPGIRKIRTMRYGEQLMVGYRHFDTNRVAPQFPFGFGLSYTTFALSQPVLSSRILKKGESLTVTLTVTNTGQHRGAEVVQLYVSDRDAALPRPAKELKGFIKVHLDPGASATVSFTLSDEHLSYYDPCWHQWVAEPGEFMLLIGTSSRHILSEEAFILSGE